MKNSPRICPHPVSIEVLNSFQVEFKTVSVDGKDYKNKLQLMQLASDELVRSAEEKANKRNIST